MRPGALLVGAALLAACAHAPARGPRLDSAVGEGWAPVVTSDPIGTRRRALAAALREAVEKTAGAAVTGRTRVDRAVAVDDTITSRTNGVVRSYEVLGETEDGGFHKTRVRARVEQNPVTVAAPRPEPPPGDPKVAVVIGGPNGADAAAGVRRGLIEKGFTVIDGKGADITVRGDVSVTELGFVGPWNSSRARVSLEARAVKSGRVLWSSSREASAVGPAVAAADAKASETAGALGGEELAREVEARLAD